MIELLQEPYVTSESETSGRTVGRTSAHLKFNLCDYRKGQLPELIITFSCATLLQHNHVVSAPAVAVEGNTDEGTDLIGVKPLNLLYCCDVNYIIVKMQHVGLPVGGDIVLILSLNVECCCAIPKKIK